MGKIYTKTSDGKFEVSETVTVKKVFTIEALNKQIQILEEQLAIFKERKAEAEKLK